MQLKVADEQLIALTNEAQVDGEVIVGKKTLTFMIGVDFIINQVSLGHGVVVVQSVAPLSLHVAIARIVQGVEAVHKVKLWRFVDVKDFLVQRVEILSVVNDDFSIGCGNKPLVVGL
jgi:hypothetical protein